MSYRVRTLLNCKLLRARIFEMPHKNKLVRVFIVKNNWSYLFFTYYQYSSRDCFLCYSYLVSGDADGKCYIWDWKSTKLYKKWKAHDGVCISALWHPHEPSKVLTAGWDGAIKYWD